MRTGMWTWWMLIREVNDSCHLRIQLRKRLGWSRLFSSIRHQSENKKTGHNVRLSPAPELWTSKSKSQGRRSLTYPLQVQNYWRRHFLVPNRGRLLPGRGIKRIQRQRHMFCFQASPGDEENEESNDQHIEGWQTRRASRSGKTVGKLMQSGRTGPGIAGRYDSQRYSWEKNSNKAFPV